MDFHRFDAARAFALVFAATLLTSGSVAFSTDGAGATASAAAPVPSGAVARRLDRPLLDFTVTTYGAKEGAPTDIEAIAQTPDGFLWLAASEGLVRFDGVNFTQDMPTTLPRRSVATLFVDTNGDLWAGYRYGGISRLSHGKLTDVDSGLERNSGGQPRSIVNGIARDKEGTLWAADTRHLYRLVNGGWHMMGEQDGYAIHIPRTFMGLLRDGTLWVSDGLQRAWRWNSDTKQFESIDYQVLWESQFGVAFSALPADAAAKLRELTKNTLPGGFAATKVDQSGAIWSAIDPAITRFRWVSTSAGKKQYSVDTLSRAGIPYGDDVVTLFVDREGDIWAGELGGLERFRPNKLNVVAPSEKILGPAIGKGAHGDVWVGASQHGDVFNVQAGVVTAWPGLGNSLVSVSTDSDGSVWFLGQGYDPSFQGIRVLTEKGIRQLAYPAGAPPVFANAIVDDPRGGKLLSMGFGHGLYRLVDGVWMPGAGREGGLDEPSMRLIRDDHGLLWVGYASNRLSIITGDSVKNYTAADGLSVGNVKAIGVTDGDAWIAGSDGVNHKIGQRFLPLLASGEVDFHGAGGIVKTKRGELWINASAGLYQISRRELERAEADPRYKVKPQLFDQNDGLQGGSIDGRPGPTVIEGDDGRIWATRMEGIASIDPGDIVGNSVAPRVEMQSISADDNDINPQSIPKLAPGVRMVRFSYTAPSLSMPEKVIFRYRLDGFDHDWESAGSRRQASYANLAPGTYTFRVIAANEDGVWSGEEAVSRFIITPYFYQTLWFKLLVVVVLFSLVWLLFLLRFRQLHARLKLRMAEREELARELHDTLLQGIASMTLHMQIWAEDSRLTDVRRNEMAAVSRYAGEMMVEGRDRITSLRASSDEPIDLISDINSLTETYSSLHGTALSVRQNGMPRKLRPDVVRGVLDINRESVRNAFVHSVASAIHVVISYEDRAFSVRVADNGKGMPSDVLTAGRKPGHWGIAGMFERARNMGAVVEITPVPTGGTALTLIVPAKIAYVTAWTRLLAAVSMQFPILDKPGRGKLGKYRLLPTQGEEKSRSVRSD